MRNSQINTCAPNSWLSALGAVFIRHCMTLARLLFLKISDSILLKPGPLDAGRPKACVPTRARGGIIDEMLASFDFGSIEHVDILRNIAEFRHEAVNGKGYPRGLQGQDIPLEARIVAVADVFDALTSRRP